jgi:hypothetical protein
MVTPHRQDQHEGVRPGRPQDGAGGVRFDHSHRHHHQDPTEHRQRDLRSQWREKEEDGEEHHSVECRGDSGLGSGADVDCGSRQGAGGRHAAKEAHGDVGQTLAEEFPIRIVALLDRLTVGHDRREQALQCGEDRHRQRHPGDVDHPAHREHREVGDGDRAGDAGDPGHAVEPVEQRDSGADEQGHHTRRNRPQPRNPQPEHHHRGSRGAEHQGRPGR